MFPDFDNKKQMRGTSLSIYDKEVIERIIDKYAMEPMEAARQFLTSETHAMLEDPELEMMMFGFPGIFDMWEAEKITGDPRNSIYIRGE